MDLNILGLTYFLILKRRTVPYPELFWSWYTSLGSNSNPQTLKNVDLWCKLSSMFLVTEWREWCFELFRTQNSQKFPGFCPWTQLGRAYSAVPDSPATQQYPQKIAGYSTAEWLFFINHLTLSIEICSNFNSPLF